MKHNFGLLLLLADTSNFEICEIYPFIRDNVCLCICCGVNRGIWSLFTSFCRVCLPALSFLVVLAVSGGHVNGLMSIKLRFSCFCKYHTCLYLNNRSGASEKLKNWALQCHIKKKEKSCKPNKLYYLPFRNGNGKEITSGQQTHSHRCSFT